METARLFTFERLEQEPSPEFSANQLELAKHGSKITIKLQLGFYCVMSEDHDPLLFDNDFLAVYYWPGKGEWDFSNKYVNLNFRFNIGQWRVVGIDDPTTDDQTVILDQNQELTVGNETLKPLMIIGKADEKKDALALFISHEEDIDGIAATFLQRSEPVILYHRTEIEPVEVLREEPSPGQEIHELTSSLPIVDEKPPELKTQVLKFVSGDISPITKKTRRTRQNRTGDITDDPWDVIGFDLEAAGEAPEGSIWLDKPRKGQVFPQSTRNSTTETKKPVVKINNTQNQKKIRRRKKIIEN